MMHLRLHFKVSTRYIWPEVYYQHDVRQPACNPYHGTVLQMRVHTTSMVTIFAPLPGLQ